MMNVTIGKLKKKKMNELVFNDFTTLELFEYLLDHLIIPPDSEFDEWRHYKLDMRDMCKNFYERNVNVEI